MRIERDHGAAFGRLLELTVLLGEDMSRSLARDGLTESRAHLLWELRQQGPSTQGTLARALGVTPRNVTGLVDALAETGFVERRPHPTDRRATLVTFTDRGARIAEEFERGRAEVADLLFGALPDDLLAAFVEGMDHVLGRLRAALAEAPEAAVQEAAVQEAEVQEAEAQEAAAQEAGDPKAGERDAEDRESDR